MLLIFLLYVHIFVSKVFSCKMYTCKDYLWIHYDSSSSFHSMQSNNVTESERELKRLQLGEKAIKEQVPGRIYQQ